MEPVEFVLLANGAKGAAAVSLIKQVSGHSTAFVDMIQNSFSIGR